MNTNWTKEQTEEAIIKQIKKDFGNQLYDIEFFIKSDDGGKHIEARVLGHLNSNDLRKKIPINYNGWRTIVSYTPLEVVLKKK
jgi:hypothetical protein